MKKSFWFLLLILAAGMLLYGCGGGGSSSPDDVFTPPPTTIPIDPVDPGNTPTEPVPVSAIQLTVTSSAIRTGQTTAVTATLFNASGQTVSSSKQLAFSLSNPTLGSIPSPVIVSNGSTTQTFTARNIEGTVTITASVDGKTATQTVQISNQVAAATIQVAANPTTLTLGGTSVVTATVRDGNNTLVPNGTTVNFTVGNTTLGTIVASATTTAGVAQATFSAGLTTPGTATITATSGAASGTTTIAIAGTAAGSIEFLSANPQVVSIKGAGGQETSNIQFLIKDSNGNPATGNQTVRLTLSGPNGGEYLGAETGTTVLDVGTVNGIASVILHSGTIPGTATITATVVDNDSLTTSSGVIAIGGGIPSASHFSLSAEKLNVEGGAYDNITNDILVLLADRYGNKEVLKGTAVSFYSECGAIGRAVALDEIGQGKVVFRTQTPAPRNVEPGACGARCDQEAAVIASFQDIFGIALPFAGRNPRDGLCTITAVVDGEENFVDQNANGAYELGEPFTDTFDDIHIDMDDNGLYDSGYEQLVVDRNNNGLFNGSNGTWDANKRIAKSIDILYTGVPTLTLSERSFDVTMPEGQTIFFALHDENFNRPIGGTKITVKLNGSGATLSGNKEFTYLDSSALGTPVLAVSVAGNPTNTEDVVVELEFSYIWKGVTTIDSISGIIRKPAPPAL